MAVLSAIFRGVDEMSSILDRMASSGEAAVTQWERAGSAANDAFSRATSSATGTAQAANSAGSCADSLSDSFQANAQAADEVARSIGNIGDESEAAVQQSEEFGNSSVNAVQGLSKALVAAGIATALKGIYEGLMECSAAAAEFETANAQVATIADTAQISMSQISGSILDMSNDTGKAASGLSEAVYQALSAGIETGGALEFSATATKLAAGGFTQAATAVDVLTTAINAYGLESSDASKISDMLIVTQNLGKTTVDELAASVGKVIPLASAYGVEMDNLSTAYDQLTAGGVATAEAGTYLKALLNELGNSSSDVASTLQDETGQSFAMLIEQGYSLGDVLDVLGGSVDGDTTKFNELWSSTEAGVGALSLFNSGSEEFNGVLEQMQNSAGATGKAYETMSNTTAHAQEKMQTASTNLQTVIGGQLNPTLSKLYEAGAEAFSWAGDFLEENPAVTAGLTATVVGVTAIGGALAVYSVAQSVAKAGTIAHTVAQAALNLVMKANPVFLIVTGVVALTAAVATFVTVLANQETEYETWTASTKKQYDELESLNSEYDRACEQYGKTSEEALRLRSKVDDLSASFEASQKTVEEFMAECDALAEAHDKLISSYQDNLTEINNNEMGTLALIQKLSDLSAVTDDLSTATDESSVGAEQMKTIIDELNKSVPGLALTYDEVTNSVDASVEAYKKAAEAQAEQLRYQENFETYSNALKEQPALAAKVAEAEANLAEERARATDNFWLGTSNTNDPFVRLLSDCDEYEEKLKEFQALQDENTALISKCNAEYENMSQAIEEAAKAPVLFEDAVKNALDSVRVEMEELSAKYDEAYEAARSSLDGQIGLFDEVAEKVGLSSGKIIDTWQQQIDYLDSYNDNLQKLSEYSIDADFLAQLSDGTAESVGQVSALVGELDKLGGTNATAKVDEINKTFLKLSEAKDSTALTMADIETDFSNTLGDMEKELASAVEKMNMSDGAKSAATTTMSGYIQAIRDMQGQAVSAAEATAKAVAAALSSSYDTETGTVTTALPKGYATETASAAAGIALVGEKGPELINFGGGETVYTTEETGRILSAEGNVPMNVAAPEGMELSGGERSDVNVSERKITLEIAGSGAIDVSGPFDEERLMSLLFSNLKPALMGLLKKEIYEEGDLAYEF